MRIASLILLWIILCSPCLADKVESEPNNTRADANGPIEFDEKLKGWLPGANTGEASPFEDYWSFWAKANHQYNFEARPYETSFLYPLDIDLEIVNSAGATVATATTGGDNQIETLTWTAPPVAGMYYLVVYEGTGIPNPVAYYEITCTEILPPDSIPPTYPGGGSGGILSVERIAEYSAIQATWLLATDNISTPDTIRYNVYCSPLESEVFTGSPKASFTGVNSGALTGLTPGTSYYLGVRAEDQAGNEEKNTVTLLSEGMAAVEWITWMLYD